MTWALRTPYAPRRMKRLARSAGPFPVSGAREGHGAEPLHNPERGAAGPCLPVETAAAAEAADPPGLLEAGSAEYRAYRATRHHPALDGLRALSILAVLWHHTAAGTGGIAVSDHGFLGVDMFFVLSGFLIVTGLLRERERNGSVSLRHFYLRRTLRILPIYYLVLAAVLFFVTVVRPSSDMRAPFLHELPWHAAYLSNWIRSSTLLAIAWSLAAEEQFYLLWPPVEARFPRWSVALVLLVIALNQLVNFQVLDGFLASAFGLQHAEYAILQVTFTPICLGVLLAHVLHRPAGFECVGAVLAHRFAPWLVLAALLAACSVGGDLSGLPRLVIQLVMVLLLGTCVLRAELPVARSLANAPLRRVGVISYGMYLYHPIALHASVAGLAALGSTSPLLLFLACTALTIAIAEASFRWIESPLARWKRRFGEAPPLRVGGSAPTGA